MEVYPVQLQPDRLRHLREGVAVVGQVVRGVAAVLSGGGAGGPAIVGAEEQGPVRGEFDLRTEERRWCNGIMQDSHSCDPGSIPGRRIKIFFLEGP